jgi:hypothetical protein
VGSNGGSVALTIHWMQGLQFSHTRSLPVSMFRMKYCGGVPTDTAIAYSCPSTTASTGLSKFPLELASSTLREKYSARVKLLLAAAAILSDCELVLYVLAADAGESG